MSLPQRVLRDPPGEAGPTERAAPLAMELRQALEASRLTPHYQPVFELRSGRIAGFEALMRWEHPTRGLLETAGFAAAFDDPELAGALSARLLDDVGRHMLGWRAGGYAPGEIALNVSDLQLRQGGLAESLAVWIEAQRLKPAQVVIELAEGTEFGPGSGAAAELRRLAALGVTVALDNFGAGTASMVLLRQIEVNRVKIARQYIARLEDEPDDAGLVAGLIGFARSLGIKTVAEGVERPSQLSMLTAEGCDYAQGYLLGRPMAAPAVPLFAGGIG
ncbi:EAL domain-containing protein [Bosea sp. 117]|uniref:EAL domain-containing protein n=1 Tax=Bosea sp. 117 TaxID=1125973 RepID=UPI00049447E4|nr:EAL domain-containing protein [Bosea sp. 117]